QQGRLQRLHERPHGTVHARFYRDQSGWVRLDLVQRHLRRDWQVRSDSHGQSEVTRDCRTAGAVPRGALCVPTFLSLPAEATAGAGNPGGSPEATRRRRRAIQARPYWIGNRMSITYPPELLPSPLPDDEVRLPNASAEG